LNALGTGWTGLGGDRDTKAGISLQKIELIILSKKSFIFFFLYFQEWREKSEKYKSEYYFFL
jgi:hypothetical protein